MAKRLLLSAAAGIGVTLLLGSLAGVIAAVLVYAHLYNQEIEAFEKAMHEAEFDCVRRETKPLRLDSDATTQTTSISEPTTNRVAIW